MTHGSHDALEAAANRLRTQWTRTSKIVDEDGNVLLPYVEDLAVVADAWLSERHDLLDAAKLIHRLLYRLDRMGADKIQARARAQLREQSMGWLERKGLHISPLR